MKYEVNEALEVCLGICLNQQITKFQALWKKFKWRRWFLQLKQGTARIKVLIEVILEILESVSEISEIQEIDKADEIESDRAQEEDI